MPTYQYECDACGAPLEAVQSFSDAALTQCPACGAEALRKVYGSVGVVFKGSGFYRTDSRSSSSTPTAAPAAKPATTTTSAPSTSATTTSTSTSSTKTSSTPKNK